MINKIGKYFSLVKFSHTIFAMPFAFIGFFLAYKMSGSSINIVLFLLVILCMVFARNAAMAFNRYLDRDIDKENKRTQFREIPQGIIKPKSALIFVIVNAVLFIATTYFINSLCFYLSPVALIVILGYSYFKRCTALCHFILGLGLSLAPIGAYLSVTGKFDLLPVMFSLIVLFWVSGFDIIYSLQDIDFDKSQKLNSIPALLGKRNALILSAILHAFSSLIVLYIGYYANFGIFYWIGALAFIGLLWYQHLIVKPDDLSKVNIAFFTTNGIASIIFACFTILSLFF
ncbi:MAG: 4-hydroxybenzoate octaprenyltransferase [Bacteroidetes bacterium]|nr:4-hydroxybenzoate octaprenyltransferase [Bacteroidota bacterium]